ncbi:MULTISPECIES: hypothetical protein [unclassified Bradyrhizobium]|uniref:hypothetical protein n=1 Tax=unclassified Bradyrhizobium TaxID=2631580 RepID=UPI002915F66F|nr:MULTISPECIES: hypothetical protein [unclassified Bradyrhizobium]
MTSAEQQIMDRFERALTDRLVADFYGQIDLHLYSELARARAAAQKIGDERAYRLAVDNAFREQTACMAAAWATRGRA